MIKIKSKKINPSKSNKMIWAVAGGLSLLIICISLLLFFQNKPANLYDQIDKTLSYLKNADGIINIHIQTAPNRVLIVYDSNFSKDFEQIAHIAALRLAPGVGACTLELAKNTPGQVVYRIDMQNGSIVNEERPAN